MASGGFLNSPRVRVFWGKINLSSYNGSENFPKNTPVVYDVQVDLNAENEGPTASMKWDPTGPGAALYEWFISKPDYMGTQITIEFFYSGGKRIVFVFVWTGQEINYGNDMTITVKMQSELAGLINANIRNTAQAYDEKKGATPLDMVNRAKTQFGLNGFADLIKYNSASLAYWKQVRMLTAYGNDWTFGNNIAQIAKQTGDMTFANNIGVANVTIMPPFSWSNPKTREEVEVLNGATDIGVGQIPDPSKRYGYILGPSIINTVSRTSNWKPPQQDNTNTPGTQVRARDPVTGRYTKNPSTNPQNTSSNPNAAAKRTSSPLGPTNGRANLSIQNKDNPYGVNRQNALNDEKAAELQLSTLMCPVLVGVKPHDILYIPSLTGKYIEDWIVQSVSYSQSDGNVTVNVRATRVYGQGVPMNKRAADKFTTYARGRGLIGPNATLENWDAYAWGLSGNT